MSIPFDGKWFYPPRTRNTCPYKPGPLLNMWRKFPDVMAQEKWNGDRNEIIISPTRQVQMWTRTPDDDGHPVRQKYDIPEPMRQKVLALAPEGFWTVFDTELVHKRVADGPKNTLYFYDVLVWKDQHLIDSTYLERWNILHGLMGDAYATIEGSDAEAVKALGDNNLYLARNIPPAEWDSAWEKVQRYTFLEGFVLKRGNGRLEISGREHNNSGWMLRMRKGTLNYRN